MRSWQTHRSGRRSGLTLMELLVVMTILAIMTTIAVTATDKVIDQGRYDATRRTQEALRAAIVGPDSPNAEGVAGFVADVGRPPANLSELLTGTGITPYQAQPISMYGLTDTIMAGWRGPYLRLGASAALTDGWGNASFGLSNSGGTAPITTHIQAAGPDAVLGNADDMPVLPVSYTEYTAASLRYSVAEEGDLSDTANVLDVWAFVRNGTGAVGALPLISAMARPGAGTPFTASGLVPAPLASLPAFPVGPVAMCAVVRATSGATVALKRSPLVHINVLPRVTINKALVIR